MNNLDFSFFLYFLGILIILPNTSPFPSPPWPEGLYSAFHTCLTFLQFSYPEKKDYQKIHWNPTHLSSLFTHLPYM